MKRIKICILCSVQFTYDKFLKLFAEKLDSENYEVHAAFSFNNEINFQKNSSITYHNLPLKRKATFFEIINIVNFLKNFFEREKFDIIHVHTPSASIYARLANFISARKAILIYVVHGFYFHENMKKINYLIHFLLEYILSKFAEYLFFVSNEDYKLAKSFHFRKFSNLKYISNGIDSERFFPFEVQIKKELREKYKIPENAICVGIVARLVKEKGYCELITAIKKLFIKYSNLHLVIAGSYLSSDYQGSAIKIIEDLKEEYPTKVSLLGEIDFVEEIYNIMDIFCLPSHREGLPYSIIEAMLCGIPIVTTNIRGCRELIQNNYSGLLTKYKSSYDLKKNIESLVTNAELRNYFSKNARNFALENHNLNKVLNDHLAIIQEIK